MDSVTVLLNYLMCLWDPTLELVVVVVGWVVARLVVVGLGEKEAGEKRAPQRRNPSQGQETNREEEEGEEKEGEEEEGGVPPFSPLSLMSLYTTDVEIT